MVEGDDGDDRELFERPTEVSDPAVPDAPVIAGASFAREAVPSAAALTEADEPGRPGPPAAAPVGWSGGDPRYAPQAPIGAGGMGEVILCRDHAVGRDVAMKLIRGRARERRAEIQRRFVHEARVQGQLEHPAIVPVYDVGLDADGALYFTMKHVRGVSLRDVLRGLRDGDPAIRVRFSRRRLLTLFSQICMAVHFAHGKGVVHRDLKPANLMFGDFGEAYVLDWGLALAPGAAEPGPAPTSGLGTAGYMAPEQVDPAQGDGPIDGRADVYALGVILYELLTLEPAHGGGTLTELLQSTLDRDGLEPAAAAPGRDVPPELDALCYRATRRRPSDRLASAAELSRAVEAFLDGDRDLARRRQLAAGHAAAAERAFAEAGAAGAPEVEHAERARAMRDVAAALGLDPDQPSARQTLVRLLAEPPATPPPAAQVRMAARVLEAYRLGGRAALAFYAGYLLYLPLLLWMGVRDHGLFALGWTTIALCAAATYAMLRRPPARIDRPLGHLALSTFTVGTASVMFGPFVLVPMLGVAMCVCYTASIGHMRGLVPVASCLTVLVPAVLGWLGLIPATSWFEGGQWRIQSPVFVISAVPTQVFLIMGAIGTIAPACVFVARLRSAYLEAERRLELQAWQLRQIVPDGVAVTPR
ncbi:MAG TPA: serine/threonine-protein kinase [Kofleriaceae bacterium]|nr:serine/threonine-protein kinase [Kofleriaceae bacterium]